MKITSKIICDSVSKDNIRVITLETNAPKFIDAQFCKHRMMSSNSSSSRAIPTHKLIALVRNDPFVPVSWRANERGMQGYKPLPSHIATAARIEWIRSANNAASVAESMLKQGVHKQTTNRVLEPYLFQKKVVTATMNEYTNFFALRLSEDSQPEIQELARTMYKAIEDSTPEVLKYEGWHLPYVPKYDMEGNPSFYKDPTLAIKCSVARCARVSYNKHDGTEPNVQQDLALYKKLLDSKHLSCFEHQLTPMASIDAPLDCNSVAYPDTWQKGVTSMSSEEELYSANMKGWLQYRKVLNNV